jgi:hypothetical protein
MNKKWKTALRTSFDAPRPTDKERFLKTLLFPKITYHRFLLSQFHYIRKRLWAASIIIVFIGWANVFFSSPYINWREETGRIWSVSAILPFLAMLTTTELYRSSFYRMAELEAVCRYSLSQIVMARITILGGGNFVILVLLLIFMSKASAYGILHVVTFMMVPYLVTCSICLLILNRARGRESVYYCASAASLVCAVNIVFSSTVQSLYSSRYLSYWLLLFIFSGVLIGIQIRNLLKHTEGGTWNLLLTE